MTLITNIPSPPPRPEQAHKGTFGTVIVIGGCDNMIGAPALCARAALRSGVGLVKVACPPSVLPFVLTIEPSATGISLSDEPSDALAEIERADPQKKAVLAVGPGLGTDTSRGEFIEALLSDSRPIVLDADGLNLLARRVNQLDDLSKRRAPLVLTPHPGEYRRLADALGIDANAVGDEAARCQAASLLARHTKAVVVLKGHRTIIAEGNYIEINQTGNPALATAGSGDVLTGLIASLIAQGKIAFEAAQLAAHVHGLAADLWAKQHGNRGLRAIELADLLPTAFAALSGS